MAIKKYCERKSRIKTIGRHPLHKSLRSEPLSQTHPMFVEEWKNTGPDTPDNVTAGSGKKVNWQCHHCKNFLHKVSINRRTRAVDEGSEFQGCKFCSGSYLREKELIPLPKYLLDECVEEKNLTPKEELFCNSSELRLWQCPSCAHCYRTKIQARLGFKPYKIEHDCPRCFEGERVNLENKSDKKILKRFKKIKRNQGFDCRNLPEYYFVYWSCDEGKHLIYRSYLQILAGRTSCSPCSKQATRFLSDFEDLAEQFVEAIRHPHWKPENIKAGSSMVAIWQCPESPDHKWRNAVFRRTLEQRGCPFCSNRRLSVTNNFASCFPELANEWNYWKNESTPHSIKSGDRTKFWFICSKGHEYSASAWERVKRHVGCKICQVKDSCLAKSHSDLIDTWHPFLNGELTIWNVSAGSQKKIWWTCPLDEDHIYRRSARDHCLRKLECPFCRKQELKSTSIPEINIALI